jgi:enolase-phosphatase E1
VTVSLTTVPTRVVLLDIEGTTTPIDFVYRVLFPYARTHVHSFLDREWNTPACQQAVAWLGREWAADRMGSSSVREPALSREVTPSPDALALPAFTPAEALEYVLALMDEDRKSQGLKALQGIIWREGFQAGELKGQVYSDVPAALPRWRASHVATCIYSSGSVLSQRLLFASVETGDLTPYLSGFFDTEVGPKTDAESYRSIARRLDVSSDACLFVSDVTGELDAAKTAGMRTALCVRSGAAPAGSSHPVVRTFDEIVV